MHYTFDISQHHCYGLGVCHVSTEDDATFELRTISLGATRDGGGHGVSCDRTCL